MTTTGCYTCDREAEFDQLPPRERIAYDEHWRVVHATGSGLLGWLVLVPRRHVMEVAELTDAEAAGLGAWQVRLARVLAAELDAPKSYVAEFGEAPGYRNAGQCSAFQGGGEGPRWGPPRPEQCFRAGWFCCSM